MPLEATGEPVVAPPKLWLCGSVGTSFPTPRQNRPGYQGWVVGGTVCEGEHASHHTLSQNGRAGYSACI